VGKSRSPNLLLITQAFEIIGVLTPGLFLGRVPAAGNENPPIDIGG
jgi:hypothetical protein